MEATAYHEAGHVFMAPTSVPASAPSRSNRIATMVPIVSETRRVAIVEAVQERRDQPADFLAQLPVAVAIAGVVSDVLIPAFQPVSELRIFHPDQGGLRLGASVAVSEC